MEELRDPIVFKDPESKLENYISMRLLRMDLLNLRKSEKLSQKDVSYKSGLSMSCISGIENDGSVSPYLKSVIKYIDALGYEICLRKKEV
jgi:predicted transcriptional regulator